MRQSIQQFRGAGGDHLVSEAFYLSDPAELGIEVYADRPRSSWRRVGRELVLATDPVDVDGLLAAAEGLRWAGPGARPAGEQDARLLEWTIALPSAADVMAVAANLHDHGFAPRTEGDDVVTDDPLGTTARVVVG